jgi:hypothetical protein
MFKTIRSFITTMQGLTNALNNNSAKVEALVVEQKATGAKFDELLVNTAYLAEAKRKERIAAGHKD